ncbi:MAG: repressor LexA [Anaerolineaceae bacterium]|jgi:repressor LexA|nr:repressor LexA [Anaerolineaceae bacterium]MDI9530857.1 transcriptional repressor LexA [Chloroflexota bacterium]HOF27930.1 transcriptional repressor LexA [Anaerolineaceae bacterium]
MTRKRVGLSPRHKKILSFLEAFQSKNGYPPSIREIGDHTQISSTSVVNYYLNQLEEMHYIERVSNVSRGINLLKTSKGNSVKNPMTAVTDFADQLISIPLVGNIIAGEPMPVPASDFSYYDSESGIDIARSLLPAGDHPEDLYALRVHGDSMIDAMVNDGDIVVMQKTNQARNGEMVAIWLNDRDETTLKYFYLENGQVRLQPANPTMKPIIIRDPSIVEVQGKVVLVIRQLDQ